MVEELFLYDYFSKNFMANQEHIKWLKKGVDFWNAKCQQYYDQFNFFRPNFSEADLLIELQGSKYKERWEPFNRGFFLEGINLKDGNFRGANLTFFGLKEAKLQNALFQGALLSRTDLRDANLASADFTDALLISADLRGVCAGGTNFTGADLRKADLRGAELIEANFTRANLKGAEFGDADLSRAVLTGANLDGSDLEGVDFSYVDLTRANLRGAELKGTNFSHTILIDTCIADTQPLASLLYPESSATKRPILDIPKEIKSVGDLVEMRQFFEKNYKINLKRIFFDFDNDYQFYFRGEKDSSWNLHPSVMRDSSEGIAVFRNKEGEMLLDLVSRRPEDFIGATSALSQWVIAQQHGLKTRLLDITRNPLVALFHACEYRDDPEKLDNVSQSAIDSSVSEDFLSSGNLDYKDNHGDKNGTLHVFVVPKDLVKRFDSDTISVVANLAKLPRLEQDRLMGKSTGFRRRGGRDEYPSEYYHIMKRLYHHIGQEKPYFKERINIKDLFRVFVVEPQQSFERIRVQSGAFLISAFHERFEAERILALNENIPVYYHYKLAVPAEKKQDILEELRFLNVTREVLFPGLDETTKAIIDHHESNY